MAEYIDKQIILDKCQRLIDVERKQGSDVMNYGRERVNQTEVIMEYIEYMTPTADVIERSKIDKAIEEIENEIKFWDCPVNYQEPLLVQKVKQAKANSYRHALEIIKRHIGEDKNNE